jgi:nucleoside-diphosphate-sugar epimerase
MKVLFIGGTGNISSAVSEKCVESGIDLFLLNRGNSKIEIPGATAICADITDEKNISEILKNHTWDVVVNWIAFKEEDITRDFRLFNGKAKQYFFISSASAYQKPLENPIITEETPLKNPFWEYSRNKIACENKLNELYRQNDFPITIVRPSLTYNNVIPVTLGGWKEYTIIDRMKKGKKVIVHGDGSSLWTITHAIDFAEGLVGLLGNEKAIGETFHITSDEILTWDQIYKYVAEAAGVKPNIIHIASDFICTVEPSLTGSLLGDKSVSAIFDNSKIKSFVPSYEAKIPFREGIKNTIKWFEADPNRMIINPESNKLIDRIISEYER